MQTSDNPEVFRPGPTLEDILGPVRHARQNAAAAAPRALPLPPVASPLLETMRLHDWMLRTLFTDADLAQAGFTIGAEEASRMTSHQLWQSAPPNWSATRHVIAQNQVLAVMIGVDPQYDAPGCKDDIARRQDTVLARLRAMTDAELQAAGIAHTAAQIAAAPVETMVDRQKLILAVVAAAS